MSELLIDIKTKIINKLGDFSIILTALAQKNITTQNIYLYDNYRFEAISETIYDCTDETFPKLTKSNTPKSIASLQYTIHLSYLAEFILSKRKFND